MVKVKRIFLSWQKRNQVHAELFRSYKSSKNEADGVPDSSMEGQEAIQISVKFGNATKNRNGSAVISGVRPASIKVSAAKCRQFSSKVLKGKKQ